MSPVKDSCSTPPGKESSAATSSSRRSKTMPIDGPAAKFLYAIIKQLDLKGIDWPLVASQLDISNGHAARMRYHRFRNQMEGINPTQRKRTVSNSTYKSNKNPLKKGLQRVMTPEPTSPVKEEPSTGNDSSYGPSQLSPFIKNEQLHESKQSGPAIKTEQPYAKQIPSISEIPQYESPMVSSPYLMPATAALYDQMNLAPELRTNPFIPSSMPPYPPVPEAFTSRLPPVAWTPVKAEPRTPEEEHEDIQIVETRVKAEGRN